ncbi:PREDICTED: protein TPX2 isoform X1 [Prunus mume]|uniref:Protein TPX2 isoform X1 n=1 Tax=Prunus mume TaxID=102107 RepID=A0ABM1LRB3_PRUMU|nr:PREDICTED: protein TPX2 isoform X1 [Prunus mume]
MDEEMQNFMREAYKGDEIDLDYEFDAPKFYDFTQPDSDLEDTEAEDWFRFAGSYPPSPFIIKLLMNWQKDIPVEPVKVSAESKDVQGIRDSDSNNCMEAEVSATVDENNREFSNHMARDTQNPKTSSPAKSPPLSRVSTLMKPTASQLAKQNHRREPHLNRLSRRSGKKLEKADVNSQKSPSSDTHCTKRQKLEAGYLRKVAEHKHQPFWLHKVPIKVGGDFITVNARPKVTIPIEPNLETAHRAQRRRYKVNAKPGEQAKILKAPPLPTPKKSTVPATEFQVFNLRTSARAYAMQQTFNNVTNAPNSNENTEIKGPTFGYALTQEKSGTAFKCTACSIKKKEFKFAIDKKFLKEPPTDLFSKLSLASEAQNNAKPQSKSAFAC